MEFLFLGTIVGTKGLNGTLKVEPETNVSIKENAIVKIGFSLRYSEEYTIEKYKTTHSGYNYLKLVGINSIDEAKALIEKGVFVHEKFVEDIEKDDLYQILSGYEVIDASSNSRVGTCIGKVENPGNDLILVKTPKGEFFIPLVEMFVKFIDNKGKKIFVNLISGLLE